MKALIKFPFRTTSWDPFKELEEFENRLATAWGRGALKPNGEEAIAISEWAPIVEISEDEKEYVVKAEIPGMKKEEVKVTVDDGVLSISGERKTDKEEKNRKYHRVERAYGRFERSFTLPEQVDSTQTKAEYEDGLLQVHLPKTGKPVSKAVEVKIA